MDFAHVMLRVGNLERAKEFYTNVLGMHLLREMENTEYRYTLAFLGYGDEKDNTVIELTYNWDTSEYDLGNAFGHLALRVPDVAATCEEVRSKGGKVVREAGPLKGGTSIIAFIEDPDGYKIELVQSKG